MYWIFNGIGDSKHVRAMEEPDRWIPIQECITLWRDIPFPPILFYNFIRITTGTILNRPHC